MDKYIYNVLLSFNDIHDMIFFMGHHIFFISISVASN